MIKCKKCQKEVEDTKVTLLTHRYEGEYRGAHSYCEECLPADSCSRVSIIPFQSAKWWGYANDQRDYLRKLYGIRRPQA